jgi:hypothetical protein
VKFGSFRHREIEDAGPAARCTPLVSDLAVPNGGLRRLDAPVQVCVDVERRHAYGNWDCATQLQARGFDRYCIVQYENRGYQKSSSMILLCRQNTSGITFALLIFNLFLHELIIHTIKAFVSV